MSTVSFKGKIYSVDSHDFLIDFYHWDEDFAEWSAEELDMLPKITKEHWDVIYYIRHEFQESGKCPTVYETCRMNHLGMEDLKRLFPTGYLRGACRMSGITYKEGHLDQKFLPVTCEDYDVISAEKNYLVDVRGFLVNADDWDQFYAVHRAADMKIPGGRLTDKHWEIIQYLRDSFKENGEIPTVYQVCETAKIDLDELEKLFPDGYHRGAVKIAGLRLS